MLTRDDHCGHLRREMAHRGLAIGRRIADVAPRRPREVAEASFKRADQPRRFVDRIGGLDSIADRRVGRDLQLQHIVGGSDDARRARWNVAERADHLGMRGMSDQDHVPASLMMSDHLAMYLGDQRADGVVGHELPGQRLLPHFRRNPVRGEHYDAAFGHFAQLLDKHRALRLERGNHGPVVDNRAADIDRRAVAIQGVNNRVDRAANARAEAARGGHQCPERPQIGTKVDRLGQGAGISGGQAVQHLVPASSPRCKS